MEITTEQAFSLLLSFAAAIVLLLNLVEKVTAAVKAANRPNEVQNERLKAVEERLDKLEAAKKNDSDRMEDYEELQRVTCKALLALLEHGLDGNAVEQMTKAKQELHDCLLNR